MKTLVLIALLGYFAFECGQNSQMEHSLQKELPEQSPHRYPEWLMMVTGAGVSIGYIAFVAFTVWSCFVMSWWKPLIMFALEPLLAPALSKVVGKATYLLAFNGYVYRHSRTCYVAWAVFNAICVYALSIIILRILLAH